MKNKIYLFAFAYLFSMTVATAQRWQEKPLGVQKLLPVKISMVNERVAWVVTWGGNFSISPWRFIDTGHHFSRTIDGGQTWKSGTFPVSGYGYTGNIAAINADTAFIAHNDNIDGGIVYRTFNGGVNWTKVQSKFSTLNWVHFWDKQNGIAAYNPDFRGFGIFKTSDGGDTWTRVNFLAIPLHFTGESMYFDYAASGNTLLFATTGKRIFRSTDKGETWTVTTMPSPTQELNSITTDGRGNCLVSGGNYGDSLNFTGRFYRSQDTGLTWTALPLNQFCGTEIKYIPNTSTAITSVRKNNRPKDGKFTTMITSDHGQTWQVIDTTSRIFAFGMVNRTTGFATEYQNDTTESMVYRYIGSPLSGLWSGEILRGQLEVFPNPVVSDNITLSLNGFETSDYILLVNTISGELIHRQNLHIDVQQQIILPTNNWQSGIYTITLTSAKGSITRKVIKTN
jgi:photosystem II stability/assembly factor-like uncharacterized protein